MTDVRIFYSKTGKAKYIAHLDLIRVFQRAFKRSAIPVWYTQGFNPHIYLTFANPLPLGYESLCESAEFRLVEGMDFTEIAARLQSDLPDGIEVVSIDTPLRLPSAIVSADYSVKIFTENPECLTNSIEEFWERDEIVAAKKSKKGLRKINLKQEIVSHSAECHGDHLLLLLTMPAGIKHNVNPTLYTDCFFDHIGQRNSLTVTKLRNLCDDGEEYS
ncbi:MAG: TIGR03936 family radical SAM-associated protein [Oscillospiraceae bacterium]|nr:TIGR03936 family radical SAM-associated protein [Oscillospiraceae bacterium]